MQDLQLSGYTEVDRLNILKGGINTFRKLEELDIANKRPFYRPNSFQKYERYESKMKKKNLWYKCKPCDNKFKSVMFIEATPGDRLLRMIRETEEKHMIGNDQRIKIISKSGTKLVHLLEKKDPFAQNCIPDKCPVCDSLDSTEGKFSNCMTNNVCYEVKCKTCDSKGKTRTYTGETSRNLHTRSKEHLNGFKRSDPNNWMVKHISIDHSGIKDGVEFAWKVLRKHSKPLQRQLHEAVRISNKKDKESLNSKSEYLGQRIKRTNLDRQENILYCKTCGLELTSKQQIEQHNIRFHKRIKCMDCDYLAFGEADLSEHFRRHHV